MRCKSLKTKVLHSSGGCLHRMGVGPVASVA